MIHEYAIDPELIIAWGKDRKDCRYFFNEFGLGTSRFMADFPNLKKWRKQFRQAWATAGDNEKTRIEELFKRITEKRVHRLDEDYDPNRTWLENAEEENRRHSFQAILSVDNPRDHDQVLSATALDSLRDDHPLWHVKSQSSCARQAQEMADLLSPLLINCSELHFIDPHFGPQNARHRRPLAKFLEKVAHLRQRRLPIERIIMHTAATDKSSEASFFRQVCEQQLPALIPEGLQLELKRWQQTSGGEKLHNRYILTDIGGVKIDPGLDEGQDGESFEVILLERNPYEKQWNDYVGFPAFDLAEEPVTVMGTARRNR